MTFVFLYVFILIQNWGPVRDCSHIVDLRYYWLETLTPIWSIVSVLQGDSSEGPLYF